MNIVRLLLAILFAVAAFAFVGSVATGVVAIMSMNPLIAGGVFLCLVFVAITVFAYKVILAP